MYFSTGYLLKMPCNSLAYIYFKEITNNQVEIIRTTKNFAILSEIFCKHSIL